MIQDFESEIPDIDSFLDNEQIFGNEIPISNDEDITIGTTKSGNKVIVNKLKFSEKDEYENNGIKFTSKGSSSEYENIMERGKSITLDKKQKYGEVGTVSNALSRHAKEKLESYLKKSPQFKVIESQLNILKIEIANYKFTNNKDLVIKTQEMIDNLEVTKNKFVKLYKDKNWKEEKVVSDEKIKNSDLLKELKIQRKELEDQFNSINPNSLVSKMKNYRKLLILNFPELENKIENKIDYFEDIDSYEDIEEEINIDDYLDKAEEESTNVLTLKQEYANLCGRISEIVDLLPQEVANYNLNQLKKLLILAIPETKITDIVNKLDSVKIQSSNEISKLKGNQDITNVMFEIFDFETVEEEKPKEMLASSNIEYVKGIAYSSCSKLNMMHIYDDCVAYGLVGLTVAINKWYKTQKISNSAISFNGFAHRYVTGAIKKGMYELSSGGTISGSSMATLVHFYDGQLKSFLQNNPELKDLPKEMLDTLLDGMSSIEKPANVVTESKYSDVIGGSEGGQNADIWANVASSSMSAEVGFEFEELYKSTKQLFNLFETKIDSDTGKKEFTKNKIFNKFDYKLFKMLFGLEVKNDNIGGGKLNANNMYKQEEMGKVLEDYYASFGSKMTFTQSAMSTKIKKLKTKLKDVFIEYPGIKAGLEFLKNYIQVNCGELIEFDNVEYEFETNLNNGKMLNDNFDEVSQNPLDNELNNTFNI